MFAALLLPNFRLQAALRFRAELWALPAAVVDERTAKGLVLEITDAAAAAGVRCGMASTQALARCGALRLVPRSPAEEGVAQATLLEAGGALSPFVEATAEGVCTVDLRSANVTDWAGWTHGAVERLAALSLRAQLGVAANPDLARLAASRARPALVVQNAGAFLSGLAVAEIDAPAELIALLRDWGISQLGDLARVPKSQLMDRLGPAAGQLWERATGRSQRVLQLIRPPETFCEAFDFEQEIETTEPLLFMLRRFLEQLAQRLEAAHRVASRMTLTLLLESGAAYERLFTIPAPTAEIEVLFRILHTHLEGLQLDHRPVGLRLRIEPVKPEAQQFRLFDSPLRDPNRFGETLARLSALVGVGQVGVAELEATHRPDQVRVVEPRFSEEERPDEPAAVSLEIGLPLRRYRPPFAAHVPLQRQMPAAVFSEKIHGEVLDAAGPYRVSGGWWEAQPWSVEEWDVEMSDGALYRLSRQGDSWFVEGSYDAA